MPVFRYGMALVFMATLLGGAPPASAQAPADAAQVRADLDQLRKDFEQLRQEYGQRIAALEAKLTAASASDTPSLAGAGAAAAAASSNGQQPPAPPEPASTSATAEPAIPPEQIPQVPVGAAAGGGSSGAPVYGGSPVAGSNAFNPDMAVIGNAVGATGVNRVAPEPALQLREAEISLQAVVDPYARADFFVSVGPEGAALEEGFITFPTLPGGVLMKVGKMKAAFGKVNTLHPHVLPWIDRPLAMNLVGGEDGINDAGVSVAKLIPNPWVFLEATGQVFRGESEDLFEPSKRSDLGFVGHLRGYQDISESANLDLGVSYARGHNPSGVADGIDAGRFTTDLFGIDATVRWRPLRRSIYHSFLGRSEVIWSRRGQPSGLQRGMGFYASGDYQVGRRWFAGVRIDRSANPTDVSLIDTGQSVTLTFRPSEFSQVRSQYRRTAYATGPTANEFLFQFQFAIGAHGAHPF